MSGPAEVRRLSWPKAADLDDRSSLNCFKESVADTHAAKPEPTGVSDTPSADLGVTTGWTTSLLPESVPEIGAYRLSSDGRCGSRTRQSMKRTA